MIPCMYFTCVNTSPNKVYIKTDCTLHDIPKHVLRAGGEYTFLSCDI